ncbi:MAG: hypothetical protein GY822_21180 [Deltaproteobacteria bacterium]|nr:hypothetical protein [Deltaproteobacteria bacterium]
MLFSNTSFCKAAILPRSDLFFSRVFRLFFVVALLKSPGSHAENTGQKKQQTRKRETNHDESKEHLKDAPALPRKLNAHVEPQKVPFGGIFYLVVTFERPKGVAYSPPSTLPSTKTVRAAPATQHKIEHDVTPLNRLSPESKPVAEKTKEGGGLDAEAKRDVVWVREAYRIPFLALDLSRVKTPALLLKNVHGQTLDIPSLTVDVDNEATEPAQTTVSVPHSGAQPSSVAPDLASPNAARTSKNAPSFAMSAGPQIFVVDDTRPWVVLGIFLLTLFFAFVENRLRRIRKFHVGIRKENQVIIVKEQVSAHDRALARLDTLLAEGLLKRGEVEPFVTRLMDEVLRDYLAARFSLAAEHRTTRELAEELLDVGHVRLDIPVVRDLLEDADMVKFAKATLQVEVASKMAGKVRALIEDTRRREEKS